MRGVSHRYGNFLGCQCTRVANAGAAAGGRGIALLASGVCRCMRNLEAPAAPRAACGAASRLTFFFICYVTTYLSIELQRMQVRQLHECLSHVITGT